MRRNYTLHGQFLRKAQVFIHILVLWHRLPSPRKKRGQTSQSKPSLGGARSLHCTPGKQGLLSHASNSETIWKLVVDILRRLTTDFCVTKQITNDLFWVLCFCFYNRRVSLANQLDSLTFADLAVAGVTCRTRSTNEGAACWLTQNPGVARLIMALVRDWFASLACSKRKRENINYQTSVLHVYRFLWLT